MMRLFLGQEWMLGERIGAGGFGQVYAARSSQNASMVAKLVPKEPGAQRELLFVDLRDVRNVVPIVDSGETDDCWVLVMPRAAMSLREYLTTAGGPLEVAEAVAILTDIAITLADLSGKIVHRDLKPANVLLLDNRWCLADFGISRYAEATTAPDTQKHALSPPYAAPERWRSERASSATDVYALGVIAHELLSAAFPFAGPELHDFREQHLHTDPVRLTGVPAALAAIVDECLYKAPEARPSPGNLLARLTRFTESPPSSGLAKLQEANQALVRLRGERARRESQARSEAERRKSLDATALKGLKGIADALREAILESAPTAEFEGRHSLQWTIRLWSGRLTFVEPRHVSQRPRHLPFDVINYGELRVDVPASPAHLRRNGNRYVDRSHSLWFCDAYATGHYGWFETAFSYTIDSNISPAPYLFSADPEQAVEAFYDAETGRLLNRKNFRPRQDRIVVAWPFTPIIVDGLDEFISRWAGWFAEAAQGHVQEPDLRPGRPLDRSWRRT